MDHQKFNEGTRNYEPPKATFVPLKVEERLLSCPKIGGSHLPGGAGGSGNHSS